jgi:hypothetical protein
MFPRMDMGNAGKESDEQAISWCATVMPEDGLFIRLYSRNMGQLSGCNDNTVSSVTVPTLNLFLFPYLGVTPRINSRNSTAEFQSRD